MKLSVSNIAWNIEEELEIFEWLHANGVSGIEMAPTKIWPAWQGASLDKAIKIKKEYERKGFQIPALQAILFDKPDLQVFGSIESQSEMIQHFDKVASLAKGFGAEVLVFGSPRNRDLGQLSTEQAFIEGSNFFRRAGEVCDKWGVKLCLEPNPAIYNCNFMTHWYEILEMVNTVSHTAVCVHLDAACISLEGDDVVEAIEKCAKKITHFHVTEPSLGDFSAPSLDHATIGKALKDINYDGWLSIEMRRSDTPLKSVQDAVLQVLDWYR